MAVKVEPMADAVALVSEAWMEALETVGVHPKLAHKARDIAEYLLRLPGSPVATHPDPASSGEGGTDGE